LLIQVFSSAGLVNNLGGLKVEHNFHK